MSEYVVLWQIETLDDARRQLKGSIQRATQNFVEIGYTLRRVQETKCYQGEYESLQDFAKQEFGISASQVSRFMSIHEQFGKEGTPELDDKWKDFSQTKLIEMLNLDENTREALDPDVKRDVIRELRGEVEEANEQAKEEAFTSMITGEKQEEPIDRIIIPLLTNKKNRFPEIFDQLAEPGTEEDIRMAFSDSGFGYVRAGAGMVFLQAKQVVVNIGDDSREYTYHDLLDAILRKQNLNGTTRNDYYELVTGEKYEEEKPAVNVKNEDFEKKEVEKPKKPEPQKKNEVKKEEKPEVEPCETDSEEPEKESEEEVENPMPEPETAEAEIVDPDPIEEREEAPDDHKCIMKAPIGGHYLVIGGATMRAYDGNPEDDDEDATAIAVFNPIYCPKCGMKLFHL